VTASGRSTLLSTTSWRRSSSAGSCCSSSRDQHVEVVDGVAAGLGGAGVEHVQQDAAARDVAQEAVAEPASLRGALDEAGDVGEHHVDGRCRRAGRPHA
jgi:hypothetical protein